MYAITATGFRAIASAQDAAVGETVVQEVPAALLDALRQADQTRNSVAGNIRQQATGALADLRTFRDLAAPTNAQTVAAVKLLCRVCIALIRLQLSALDSSD